MLNLFYLFVTTNFTSTEYKALPEITKCTCTMCRKYVILFRGVKKQTDENKVVCSCI